MSSESSGKRDVQISKSLSYLLRHGAIKEKLPIDNNGYIQTEVLLKQNRLKTHKCTLEDIHRIVDKNDKQRFHLKMQIGEAGDTEEVICATQGHSIKTIQPDEKLLQQITDVAQLPDRLVHGTNITKVLLILQSGSIKKLSRNHIHLSPGVPGIDSQVISGMRYSSNVHIYLKCTQELLNEVQMFKSLNNVYLTPNDIDICLFEKVTIRIPHGNPATPNSLTTLINELDEKNIPYEVLS